MTKDHETILVISSLLKLLEMAMPDTFFATDSRVKRAKALLRQLKEQRPRMPAVSKNYAKEKAV